MNKAFLKDCLAGSIISSGKSVDGYNQIYYQTNEDLIDSYLDIDFNNKAVLSVLGSGDQVLTSRYLDSKKTDAFDINKLSLYYFYLRLWSIQYKNMLYPDVLNGNNWLISLLNMVKPRNKNEEQALKFFKYITERNRNIERLFYNVDAQPEGKTLFTKPEELSECLSPELIFYNINLFEEIELPKTYDIILISNILEWAKNDSQKLAIAHDNLTRLVNNDGVIITSNLISTTPREDIFYNFDCIKNNTGYTYIRKK